MLKRIFSPFPKMYITLSRQKSFVDRFVFNLLSESKTVSFDGKFKKKKILREDTHI